MSNPIAQNLEEVAALCRRAGARRLDVFGSAARNQFDPDSSDLDFLVEFDDLPPAEYADAFFTLKESLESLFGRSVDLVTAASLRNPYFRDRINADDLGCAGFTKAAGMTTADGAEPENGDLHDAKPARTLLTESATWSTSASVIDGKHGMVSAWS